MLHVPCLCPKRKFYEWQIGALTVDRRRLEQRDGIDRLDHMERFIELGF